MTWLWWIVVGFATLWCVCFWLALPVFLVLDTRNNWEHGHTSLSGYIHTLVRVPVMGLVAPLYLILVIAQALGYWRE